jgi:ATP-dependent DNA ligase
VPDVPAADSIPGGLQYEPKWDGFRCLAFIEPGTVTLQSRDTRDLTRYFPEVAALLAEQITVPAVIDGEVIIPTADGRHLDFDALLNRIHPAASRVQRLAAETPAGFVAFDLVGLDGTDLSDAPLSQRRTALAGLLAEARAPLFLTPATTDASVAQLWFDQFEGAGLDGVVAKPLAGPYTPDKRTMLKVKHRRTADCVAAGYRTHKSGDGVGSLLLGLYDDAGDLQFVGVASSFAASLRRELAVQLADLRVELSGHPWALWQQGGSGRQPGAQSRWNAGKDLDWVPLRPDLVAEVAYDHMQGNRFRHTAKLVRFRPDRSADSCRYDQLERPIRFDLASVLGAG